MKLTLDYGKDGLAVTLPDTGNMTVVEPKYVEGLEDQAGAVRQALQQPIGLPPLRDLVKSTDTVGIIFYDITRPTPDHIMIPALVEELQAAGVAAEQITLFNATGTHRLNTEAELRQKLGDAVVDTFRIIQNDATDRASHVHVGTSASGNEIWIHKEFVESDIRILTGFIEPHFFAGFSGGGKAVMPGLALLDTVMRNHGARNIDHPNSTWGITYGNPLWEEIHEAALMVKPTFLLNVALNRKKQITGVFAGDMDQAHEKGCAFVKETAMVAAEEPFDIVITSNSGYPLDLNLYQSVKGMSAAAQIIKEGGSILIAAECWDGIPDHGPYGSLLREAESVEHLLATIRDPSFVQGDTWQAQIQALICQKADVYVYSDGLSDEQITDAMLLPCHNLETTFADLLQKYGQDARICVLPEGPQTIPYVKE
ncbi:nickel-dependent lactate racemase [candidate division KSB3 bacterium]|uniref:Nickel-dependent lactate racemase n=1 Tax=candidate division KSB3 bacterium TaxID=2044937 RepID=A0A9D5Q703_9BACT|nr:nickel-dependent lactate racemase [candidate division KSB3 bacterium]MBD3325411.1 nickel-dependent lactate racemase [candidate division KSB3 bacterium]